MARHKPDKGVPSPYARLQDRLKRAERYAQDPRREARRTVLAATEPEIKGNSPMAILAREEQIHRMKPVYCGAKTRSGNGKCKMAAGWGTNHPGEGACKLHGGSVPSHGVKIAKRHARSAAIMMGAPLEINPLDAIIWCIQIKAGEVQWLSEKMENLQEKEWIEDSLAGRRFHLFARQRDEATKSLVEFSKIAITLGLAERAVKLAEQYGAMLAALIKGILGDLQLTPEQQERAPSIIRKHLILVQGGLKQNELPPGLEDEAKAS